MFNFLIPNYAKAGPGVDRNAPKKKGIPLFIETFMREFTTLLKLNIIFVISCLPIITIGAAIGGMTKVTLKMVRDEPSDVYYDFKQGFKKNWQQSTLLGLAGAATLAVLICAFLFYFQLEGASFYFMMFVIGIVASLLGMMWIYIYPMSMGVNLNIKCVIKNSFLLSLIYFKYSLPAFLICALLIGTSLLFMPTSIFAFLVCSFSFCSFVSSFCAWCGIEKYIIKNVQ